MGQETTAQVFHRPNWHASLSPLIGEIVGQEGYVTEFGTIELTGVMQKDQEISKFQYASSINGPTLILGAESSLGFA